MAFLGEEFDATAVEGSSIYDPLPAGWYTAKITEAELKDTKAGTGQYIKVRYDITGPTNQGRVVYGNLNVKNPNPKAEEIGRQQLAELMRAIGLTKVRDSDQLIGGDLSIKLKITKSEEYGDGNDVAGFKAISGSVAPAQSSPAAPQSAPAAAKAPWQK